MSNSFISLLTISPRFYPDCSKRQTSNIYGYIHNFFFNWNDICYDIKPYISVWSFYVPRKADAIITRLRIGHSRLTHRHLLLAEGEPTCPHWYASILIIHHLLTDCLGFHHLYRHYFHSSSPCLTNLLVENPHHALFLFFKRCKLFSSCLSPFCLSYFFHIHFWCLIVVLSAFTFSGWKTPSRPSLAIVLLFTFISWPC